MPEGNKASLLCRGGARAGACFPLGDAVTRVGRAPDNDAVIDGPEAAIVSQYHCEIVREGEGFRVRDCNSRNGTWVDGERVEEAALGPSSILRLGQQGPEFEIVLREDTPEPLDRTVEMAAATTAGAVPGSGTHEELLSAAVHSARRMRAGGAGGQTMTIMRELLQQALRETHRRHRTVRWVLVAALLAVTGAGVWKIVTMDGEKRAIDARILGLEAELQKAQQGSEQERLLTQLSGYQEQAQALQHSLLYRLGPHDEGDPVTRLLREVMAEFGAEVYSIPPDFVERVNHYIEKDQGPERPKIAQALVESGAKLSTIRGILKAQQMPEDLAYIPIVESALAEDAEESAAGAAGPWQMTAATARAYGLKVDGETDERKDLIRSTQASCRYLKDLILDFGSGSSVMLALAAYNGGAGKVKQAVARTVRDPIQQRNFWYLYRTRALPVETSEYVPKVFAAILIGRNPKKFGF
jgi:pSer/pThr/pTyr-binding forkhead associated (FHA) protein